MKENNIALSPGEYDRVKRLLARAPNDLELAIIAALWSERCCYKSTKAYLSTLPTKDKHLERCGIIELDATHALIVNLDACAHEVNLCENALSALRREHSALGGQTILAVDRVFDNKQVNMLALALVKKANMPGNKASGVKNRVLYLGADLDKPDLVISSLVNEVCQNCINENLVVGLSSIGVAGLALSIFTMASQASTGLLINLDEINLNIQELILSEKPDRMLMIAEPAKVQRIKQIFNEKGLFCKDIGRVCSDGIVRINYAGHEVVNLPATLILENAPRYRPFYQSTVPKAFGPTLVSQTKISLHEALHKSLDYVEEIKPIAISLDNREENIVLSYLTSSELLRINAQEAAKRAVWLGALEVSIKGTSALALALCYNAPSLEQEAFMTQFKQTLDGVAESANDLGTPVIAAHVEIINHAMPMLAMAVLGLAESMPGPLNNKHQEEMLVVILGELPVDYTGAENIFSGSLKNPPLRAWEIESIKALCDVARACALQKPFYFGRALGQGGLIAALNELMRVTRRGLRLDFGAEWLPEDLPLGLISEDSPRILLCFPKSNLSTLINSCAQKVPIYIIGRLASENFSIYHDGNLVFKKYI